MGWKFIVFKSGYWEFPIIFPDKLVHAEVAQVLMATIPTVKGKPPKVISAGKIEHVNVVGLGGKSTTLGIASQPDADARMIQGYSYFHGIDINRDPSIQGIRPPLHKRPSMTKLPVLKPIKKKK